MFCFIDVDSPENVQPANLHPAVLTPVPVAAPAPGR
jgi:hypothetical protein